MAHVMKTIRTLAVGGSAAAFALLSAVSVRAATAPEGYEKAKLGMREERVRKLFPDMTRRFEWSATEGGEATVTGWLMTGRTVGSFSGCNVELRFFRGELFYVAVVYGDAPPAQAQAYLEKTYGPPKAGTTWLWETAVLSHSEKDQYWIIEDRQRSQQLRESAPGGAFIAALRQPERVGAAAAALPPTALRFESRTVRVGGQGNFAAVVGDVNRDGKPDLVVSGHADASLFVLTGRGDGAFEDPKQVAVGGIPRGLTVNDFNGDQIPDVAVATADDDSVWVLPGTAEGTLAAGTAYKAGYRPFEVVSADFNGDGKADLAVSNESNLSPAFDEKPGTVSVLLGDGKGKFADATDFPAHQYPAGVAAADLNGDGKLDLVVANWGSDDFSLLIGNGDGSFKPPLNIPYEGHAAYAVAVADLNGDQHLDLAVAEIKLGSVQVFRRDGKDGWRAQSSVRVGTGVRSMVSADLDGDGVADLATADTGTDTVSVLLGRKDGNVALVAQVPAGKKPRTVTAGDLNGDGKPDLVVTNMESEHLTLLLNTTPKAE